MSSMSKYALLVLLLLTKLLQIIIELKNMYIYHYIIIIIFLNLKMT